MQVSFGLFSKCGFVLFFFHFLKIVLHILHISSLQVFNSCLYIRPVGVSMEQTELPKPFAKTTGTESSLEHLLQQTPRHKQGCHERLRLAALLGHPLSRFATFRLQVGRILHTNMAESMILFLVTVELCMGIVELGVEHGFICMFYAEVPKELEGAFHGFLCESAEGERTASMLESCEVISRAIVGVFAVEMLLKMVVAPFQMIGNPWHLLDLMVVCTNLLVFFIPSHQRHSERLTFVLRWWRVIKFLKLIEEEAVLVEERIRKRLEAEKEEAEDSAALALSKRGLVNDKGEAPEASTPGGTYSNLVEVSPQGHSPLAPRRTPGAAARFTAKRGAKIGAGLGTVIGTTVGAAVGLLPALFTFGLSIPIFAAVGGGAGLLMGSAVGT